MSLYYVPDELKKEVVMPRKMLFSAVVLLLVAAFAAPAVAGDYVYLRNSTISDPPKILPRLDNSLSDMAFRDNPALLSLDCPYLFLFDGYYLGSYSKISTSDVMIGNGQAGTPRRERSSGDPPWTADTSAIAVVSTSGLP